MTISREGAIYALRRHLCAYIVAASTSDWFDWSNYTCNDAIERTLGKKRRVTGYSGAFIMVQCVNSDAYLTAVILGLFSAKSYGVLSGVSAVQCAVYKCYTP